MPLLLCLQEKAISKGADRCDTGLCDSWHGDHAAHRGERRLCLSRPLSPVLPYQQRRVCESVSVKGEDRKNTELLLLKGLISASPCLPRDLVKYLNVYGKDVNSYLHIQDLFVYANYSKPRFQTVSKREEDKTNTQMKGPIQ